MAVFTLQHRKSKTTKYTMLCICHSRRRLADPFDILTATQPLIINRNILKTVAIAELDDNRYLSDLKKRLAFM